MRTIISIILMIFASLLASFGQLSLKLGAMKLKVKLSELLKNYLLLAGFIFYGTSAVITIIAFKGNELTVLYPLASLNYVWVSLLSMKYLNEKMNALKWAGIVLIIVGVVIIL